MSARRSRLYAPWTELTPSHWDTIQLRRVATFKNGSDYKDIEVAFGGYPVYGSGGEFRRASQYLHDGTSVLFGRKGTVNKPLLVHGRFWTVDTMFYTELNENVDARFLRYYATTLPFGYYQTNTALPSMTQGDLAAHVLPAPPLDVQRAIADYLDRETAQIDTLIAKQAQLIATLRERRRRIIEQTATDMFNSLARSGQSRSVGSDYSVVLGKMLDGKHLASPNDTELPYVRAANVQDHGLDLMSVNVMPYSAAEAQRLNLLAEDLLVVEGGAVGTSVLLREDKAGWSFQKTVNRVRSLGDASTAWLGYVLRAYRDAGHIAILCDGSTIAHFTAEKLRALRIPVVAPTRQLEIAAQLDEQTAKIDTLIAKAEQFIKLSKERRAALITAAVTGQLEIPV